MHVIGTEVTGVGMGSVVDVVVAPTVVSAIVEVDAAVSPTEVLDARAACVLLLLHAPTTTTNTATGTNRHRAHSLERHAPATPSAATLRTSVIVPDPKLRW
ncbi:MAG TPA: hypothetical protein VGI86_02575 [Acidimicrobiia bacterium]